MSAIRQALAKLDSAVGKLEGSATTQEARQHDMFPGVLNSNGAGVSPAFVAQKLDSAIEKVESVLKETA